MPLYSFFVILPQLLTSSLCLSQECFVIPYMHVTHRETTTARWTPDQYIVDGTGWFVGGVELENKVRRESSFFSIKVLWFVRFYFRF